MELVIFAQGYGSVWDRWLCNYGWRRSAARALPRGKGRVADYRCSFGEGGERFVELPRCGVAWATQSRRRSFVAGHEYGGCADFGRWAAVGADGANGGDCGFAQIERRPVEKTRSRRKDNAEALSTRRFAEK